MKQAVRKLGLKGTMTVSTLIVVMNAMYGTIANAATLEMSWLEMNEYRDVRASDMSQKRYETRVVSELEEEFLRVAEKLPADQTLHISVDELDLAGNIQYYFSRYPNGMRVIRDFEYPRMTLSYEIKDAEGAVIENGSDDLVDRNFLFGAPSYTRGIFSYEKEMIQDWSREQLLSDDL